MAEEPKDKPPDRIAAFQKHLNRHGYPFQHAVIRRAVRLFESNESPWMFLAAEFPVEVQGDQARIDFILGRSRKSFDHPRSYLVAECKRANPSLSTWLFARAPYVRHGGSREALLMDILRSPGGRIFASPHVMHSSKDIYHVAVEVKDSEKKGDSCGEGRGAIEGAATQVLRGASGLLTFMAVQSELLPQFEDVSFVPVIFTTARLWTVETDIATANLTSGEVAMKPTDAEEKPWLWFQYHASPRLRHEATTWHPQDHHWADKGLGRLLDAEYARAIAIVGPDGIDDFLKSFNNW